MKTYKENSDEYSVAAREDLLVKASNAYHNGLPIMTDQEYDQLWKCHTADMAEKPAEFGAPTILSRVGAPVLGALTKKAHASPMFSLDNVFETADGRCPDLKRWLDGIDHACRGYRPVVVEPKIDGLSLNLTYVRGELMSAVTRGDGSEGQDVTANVLTSRMVPTRLFDKFDMEVRGEVYMDFGTFGRLNDELSKSGKDLYANPRNAAAGALRLGDPVECAKRGLKFMPHGVVSSRDETHTTWMTWLKRAGFDRFREQTIGFITEFDDNVTSLKEWLELESLGYPIDGLVFKVDSSSARRELGSTSRAPRWAVALKFKQEAVSTTLEAITVQVGRSGVLCPVAELKPVWIDGSTVSRATLHNEEHVRRLGVQVGDVVEVEKMGAIIPGIRRSITADERYADLEVYAATKYPEDDEMGRAYTVRYMMEEERPLFDLRKHVGGRCPRCGDSNIVKTPTENNQESAAWKCSNQHCTAVLAGKLMHMCSSKCLNIVGIGGEMAEALVDMTYNQCAEDWACYGQTLPTPLVMVADIVTKDFNNKEQYLAGVTWTTEAGGSMTFGTSRARKAMQSMQDAKKLPLHKWLFAMGIPSIGENTSKEISRLCENVRAVHLQCLDGGLFARLTAGDEKSGDIAEFRVSQRIGKVSARAICDFMLGADASAAIGYMRDIASSNYAPIPEKQSGALQGKLIVITGTLKINRADMQARLEAAGAKVSGSVSKKTDFLVAGENCGSKLDKAHAAGVTVVSEDQMLEMI